MLKKILLCLMITVNTYSTEEIKLNSNDNLSPVVIAAMVIGVGAIALDIYLFSNSEKLEKLISREEKAIHEVATKIVSYITVAIGVFSIPQIYPISKEIYEYTYPSEEQKAMMADAAKELIYLQAEDKFRDCCIKSTLKSTMNSFNRPVDCEELAQALIACGGQDEVNRITDIFNEFNT